MNSKRKKMVKELLSNDPEMTPRQAYELTRKPKVIGKRKTDKQ